MLEHPRAAQKNSLYNLVGVFLLCHSCALVKAGRGLAQARGGLETPFSSVIFSRLILARPALRRSRPVGGVSHRLRARARRRSLGAPPIGLHPPGSRTPPAPIHFFLLLLNARKSFHSRAGLPDLQVGRRWVHSKAATFSLADGATRCCACAGQRYTYDERA